MRVGGISFCARVCTKNASAVAKMPVRTMPNHVPASGCPRLCSPTALHASAERAAVAICTAVKRNAGMSFPNRAIRRI